MNKNTHKLHFFDTQYQRKAGQNYNILDVTK